MAAHPASAIPAAPPAKAVTLRDGRRLAYAEYGVPDGAPVFYHHGLPGSRLQWPAQDPSAVALGLRVIVCDRPGMGESDPLPGRGFTDWPADLAQVADHLGLTRFTLIGVSGGGPYAMAAARALAPRVDRLLLVSSMAPLAGVNVRRDQCLPVRLLFDTARRFPGPLRRLMPVMAGVVRRDGGAARGGIARWLPPRDRAVFMQPAVSALLRADVNESVRCTTSGVYQEVLNLVRPWDFDPADIRVPTFIWHGDADVIVPIALGRLLAASIPGAQVRWLDGEGHYQVFEHLRELLTCAKDGSFYGGLATVRLTGDLLAEVRASAGGEEE